MRKRFIIGAFIATLPVAWATAGAQQKISVGNKTAKDVAVRVQGPFTSIHVTAWDYDSVHVTGNIQKGYKLNNIFAGDPGVPARTAKIYVEGPEEMVSKGSSIELRVPRNARVWVKGGTAEVIVNGVTGDVDVSLMGGMIAVNGKPRVLTCDAIDASVNFDGYSERLRITTAAGDITMRGKSPDAGFQSVSGNIRVLDATLERATFNTYSGSVTFAGELASAASLTFDTHDGPIDVYLAGKPDATFNALSMKGTIDNQLSKNAPRPGPGGQGQRVEFELGLGSAQVSVTSFKGPIRLSMAAKKSGN